MDCPVCNKPMEYIRNFNRYGYPDNYWGCIECGKTVMPEEDNHEPSEESTLE
jgi:endogenous inhibitor of DNA gyrase (YacG/DUF329 family)